LEMIWTPVEYASGENVAEEITDPKQLLGELGELK